MKTNYKKLFLILLFTLFLFFLFTNDAANLQKDDNKYLYLDLLLSELNIVEGHQTKPYAYGYYKFIFIYLRMVTDKIYLSSNIWE